ncbi:MAG: FHA domain-containing protein [Acidobacteria bacterium]|nr:FHA domain-containing protein [Acidobacteriota bacterium]
MNAFLKITDADGKIREIELLPERIYSIGRARENDISLNDKQVSRRHAQIVGGADGYKIIDGSFAAGGEIIRSANRVFVNGAPTLEKVLEDGDRIVIGESSLKFEKAEDARFAANREVKIPKLENRNFQTERSGGEIFAVAPQVSATSSREPVISSPVKYDDKPLGHTQMLFSPDEIIGNRPNISTENDAATRAEIAALRRKAKVLELLYEMSRSLGTVFDLKEIFARATDLIFRGTPAERVVALLAEENGSGEISGYKLVPIAAKARDEKLSALTEKLTVSRTITEKVMREQVAILSQDARADAEFGAAQSIVAQGVRSTICAPLITKEIVHGVIYADRFNPFAAFTADDLDLVGAVAAQTALTVETVKAHKKLEREAVARANYGRFMPEYVVRQLLENPDSFKLGGVNQTITVLFADIRGFTMFSENEKPETVVGVLNRYFSLMSEIIFAHGGTLDKYIGDGLMALFGAPKATQEDARNAVKTAVAMQKRIATLNEEFESEGSRRIEIGVGLHTGEATVGYIGSERRSEYTAIGDTVNLASRLESNASGGQILISDATAKAAGSDIFTFSARESLNVKNRLQTVSLFEVKWN